MKKNILNLLVLALGLTLGAVAMAAGATAAGAVYANENANGSVELSNISSADNQEPVVAATDPVAPAAAAGEAEAKVAEAPKDPREQYRDKMLRPVEGTASTNPNTAVSRRYKKMDYETYRTTVLGATPQ